MIKIKKVLTLCFCVYLLATLPLAQAQMRPGQRIQEIYSQLNLTDEQKQELEVNKQQHRRKFQSAREEIQLDRDLLHAELMKPQLDMPKIKQLHAKIKGLLSQMEDDKLNSILAVRAILTAGQFSKFVNLMHKYKKEHDKE